MTLASCHEAAATDVLLWLSRLKHVEMCRHVRVTTQQLRRESGLVMFSSHG